MFGGMSKFSKSDEIGKVAEDYVAGMFTSWGLKVIPAPKRWFPDYDHLVSGYFNGKYKEINSSSPTL